MTREERGKRANELKEITLKYPEVQVRFLDAEALLGKDYTDIIFCETSNINVGRNTRSCRIYGRAYEN